MIYFADSKKIQNEPKSFTKIMIHETTDKAFQSHKKSLQIAYVFFKKNITMHIIKLTFYVSFYPRIHT